MTIYQTTAEVFFGGRRRWLSLDAACRAEARKIIKHGGDDDSDQEYMASVARIAAALRVDFALEPVPAQELRALAACRELLAARKEVERISHLIGDSLNACPMMKDPIEYGPKGPVTHLSMAYASEDVENDHGHGGTHKEWNNQHLLDDCPHCLAAHNAIQERKLARRRLGAARRAITLIGKS